MSREPKFEPRYRKQRGTWEIYVPSFLSGKDYPNGRKHSFANKTQAKKFSKEIKVAYKKFGTSITVPSVDQIKEYSLFQSKVGDKNIKEVIEAGVEVAEARKESKTLKQLEPLIETALSDKDEPLDSNYKRELLRNLNKLIEFHGEDKYISDFNPKMIDEHIDHPELNYSLNHSVGQRLLFMGLLHSGDESRL